MSENSTQLAVILVREFFGPVAAVLASPLPSVEWAANGLLQSLADVLLRNGRLPLKAISRLAKLSENLVAETLTVLMLHDLVRWVTVDEGTQEQTVYECLFEDVYPLVRAGTEIELAERHAGSPEV
jgi:RNA polymerase III subunit RPC82 helix-turn-helix domain